MTPHRSIATVTLSAALALATCSAGFSISGLTSIFAGAFWTVIGLGVAFEFGKRGAVAWLGHRYGVRTPRLALVALVAILMVLNLSGAHIEHALAGDLTVTSNRDDVMAAIMLQRTRAKDTEDQVLDFLVRHCGGVQ